MKSLIAIVCASLIVRTAAFTVAAKGVAYSPTFDGTTGCLVASASATSSFTMMLLESQELFLNLDNKTSGVSPIDELLCSGSAVSSCLLATGDLQPGTTYNVLVVNYSNSTLSVTFSASLGCLSSLTSGGGFAGVKVASNGYAQSVSVVNTSCSFFSAVASANLTGGLYVASDLTAYQAGKVSSITPVKYCTGSSCQINSTSLSRRQTYTYAVSPATTTSTSQSVSIFLSTQQGCLDNSFVVPSGQPIFFGPVNGTEVFSYQLQSTEDLLSAILTADGRVENRTISVCPALQTCTTSDVFLDEDEEYFVAFVDKSPINNTAHVEISFNEGAALAPAPSGGRKLLTAASNSPLEDPAQPRARQFAHQPFLSASTARRNLLAYTPFQLQFGPDPSQVYNSFGNPPQYPPNFGAVPFGFIEKLNSAVFMPISEGHPIQ